MAVKFDVETLRALVGDELLVAGQGHLEHDRIQELAEVDGGVSGIVEDGPAVLAVWVGIVNREFTAECDGDDCSDGSLCEHAIAVALVAFDEGVTWTATAARSVGYDGERLGVAAGRLSHKRLVRLVIEQAAADRHFAAKLLAAARLLAKPGPAEIETVRKVVTAARNLTDGHQWQLPDIVKAGMAMVDELSLLAEHPPTTRVLDLAEEAIGVWDSLAGHLHDAWEMYETEPEEIGSALADIHLRVCEDLQPEPYDLARRLTALIERADAESYLDPDAYAHLLDEDD